MAAVAVAGCRRSEEVRSYQAPQDAPASAAAPNASGRESSPAPRPPWIVPEGWVSKPDSGGFRIASYAVNAPDGRSVDISVIPLSGPSGTTLENVNRWRDQVGLGPITDADLAADRQTVAIGEYEGEWFEMVGEKPTSGAPHKTRTVAAVLALPGTTVFFKATGDDALVAENRDKFRAWLKSVQTGPPAPAGASASAGGSSDMSGPVAPPPSTQLPAWEVPPHWKSAPASTMRLATFVMGPETTPADLSVVALGPASGGALANVNRWRDQYGLPAIDDAGLAATTSTIELGGGEQATLVELEGQGATAGKRMLAAIVPRSDRTWFYKMTGDDAVVAAERDPFIRFLKSVKYP